MKHQAKRWLLRAGTCALIAILATAAMVAIVRYSGVTVLFQAKAPRDLSSEQFAFTTRHFDVTIEQLGDDETFVADVQALFNDVEQILPEHLLDLIDVPIYVRAEGSRCFGRPCVGMGHNFIESLVSGWDQRSTDNLVHEMCHIIGKYGKAGNSASYYDAFDRMRGATNEEPPTEYARTNLIEDFAESCMLYASRSELFPERSPERYAFMRNTVFGVEYVGYRVLQEIPARSGDEELWTDTFIMIPAESAEARVRETLGVVETYTETHTLGILLASADIGREARNLEYYTSIAARILPEELREPFRELRIYVAEDTSACPVPQERTDGCANPEEGWALIAQPYPNHISDQRWVRTTLSLVGEILDTQYGWSESFARIHDADVCRAPNEMARASLRNDVAESFAFYMLYPDALAEYSPKRFAFFASKLGDLERPPAEDAYFRLSDTDLQEEMLPILVSTTYEARTTRCENVNN